MGDGTRQLKNLDRLVIALASGASIALPVILILGVFGAPPEFVVFLILAMVASGIVGWSRAEKIMKWLDT